MTPMQGVRVRENNYVRVIGRGVMLMTVFVATLLYGF
jgi:hypothetical protein